MNQEVKKMNVSLANTIQSKIYNSFSMYSNNNAIRYGSEIYTYRELEIASDKVSRWLMDNGLSNGKHIALCLQDRSQLIIWILGIIKAGSVFVPMDYQAPDERIKQLLKISEADLLLTERSGKQRLSSIYPNLNIWANEDIDFSAIELNDPTLTRVEPSGDDKIYMYFTSGSTGVPKAIVGKNSSLYHFVNWEIETFGLDANCKVSQFVSPGFDAFLRDIFTALSVGGTICIPDFKISSSSQLLQWIARNEINLIHCVPSFFKLMLTNELANVPLSNLQYILMSGEKISIKDLKTWYHVMGDQVQLVNLYGPTETTMIKTYYLIKPEDVDKTSIPIGKPISGTQIFLLDENLRPVGKGSVGEIYIRTKYGTYGYYNNQKLTAERFLQNPYSTDPNDILYKTGDLGRFNASDNLEFLGRKDRQLKIRGIRVEPAEIEQRLLQYATIKEAIVKPIIEKGKKTSLCAYIIGKETINDDELKAYLAEHLPTYLIPNQIVTLPSFPLLPNGKIDFNSLPDPLKINQKKIIKPKNPLQAKMLTLWAKTLEKDPSEISIDANFMEIGGNSLKLVLLVNKIKQHFEVKIPISEIFETPTIEELTIRLHELTKEEHSIITPVAKKEYYKLSSAQKRMFFLYQFDTTSTAYNMTHTFKLTGKLDKRKLNLAFEQLFIRHEILRTRFFLKEDLPVQQVLDSVDFAIEDLGKVSDVEASISNFIVPFDLNQAPLFRVGLIKLSEEEHLLITDNHHIISDALSNRVLMEDFMAIYRGENLSELKVQYKDYAVWQQSSEQQKQLAEQKAYWLDVYSDDIPVLDLPTDRPRPEVNTNEGANLNFYLDADTTAKLSALAQKEKTTMFMVLQSIYTILLSKLSGEEDIIVGTSVAGRHHADLEGVVGVFINALALRNKLNGEISYLDYLHRLNKNTFNSFENQRYPYENLIDALKLKRDTSRPPLFNVMFEYFNFEQPTINIPGLELEPYEYELGITRFDLSLRVLNDEDRLSLSFQYSTDLFDRSSIERFADYFQNLVNNVLSNTTAALKDIDMLSPLDYELLVNTYNNTAATFEKQESLVTAFAEQVAINPDRIAVHYKDNSLSYSELDARSNQLANYLKAQGIAPGNMVGLLLNRSLDMIVGIIGVLKSGAGYVPIDPDLPEQRIRYILSQSRTSMLLSEADYLERFSAYLPIVEINHPSIWESPTTSIDAGLDMDDLAYCIFTSGSSGKPKGVMMSHRGVFNLVKGLEQTIYDNYEPGLRISLLASYAFDASVQQIFGGLLMGHSLYIADDVSRKDGLALLNFYNTNKIAVSDGTPTHLRMLMNSITGEEELSYLEGWILAGEYLDKGLVNQFYESFSTEINLYNFYGPTETCVDSTYFKIDPSLLSQYDTIPIGKPLPNERVYITDKYGSLVAPGSVGELCIAGDGLGRCYVGNQELTSERFVSNWIRGEGRVYRTGDMAKWLPDGNLEYSGRLDDQVKLRGYRIELSEIEYHLNNISEVKQAVVLLKKLEKDDALVGYYESEQELTPKFIRDSLSKDLPGYMLPSFFVHVEKLPVNLSGKIAKKELLAFDVAIKSSNAAPRNEVEESMLTIWSEVLKLSPEQIGVTSDFFELGGHSLKMVYLANKIKKEHGVTLSLKEIIKYSTIRSLSDYLKEQKSETHESIPLADPTEYYPLSSAQERMYFLNQLNKESVAYNMTQVVKLSGTLDMEKLNHAFKQLVARHESLRTVFLLKNDIPVQEIKAVDNFSITYLEKTDDISASISDFVKPFDLEHGPLFRIGIMPMSEDEHLMIIDNHHIISDMVTIEVLLRDFMGLYSGEKLPKLRLQYKDYSVWQKTHQKSVLSLQKDYWMNIFKEEVLPIELMTSYKRPATRSEKGATFEIPLNSSRAEKLKQLAKDKKLTVYSVFLAVYNILLSKMSNQEDIVVGTPVSGRTHTDLEGIVGLFVNTLALRNYPKATLTFNEFLNKVHEGTIGALDNQMYPYEELITALNVSRNASRNPLFDVFFNYTHESEHLTLENQDFKLNIFNSPFITKAKFDLSLNVIEVEEEIKLSFNYSKDLYNNKTIQRYSNYLIKIIDEVLSNNSISLSKISVLSAEEQNLILNRFNNTSITVPDQTVLGLFKERVKKSPENIAVVMDDQQLSYQDLDARSDRWAAYLTSKGLVAGDVIGLYMDRSIDFVTGILGVLKMGAAYLPINIKQPISRTLHMASESGSVLLLTNVENLLSELESQCKIVGIADLDGHSGKIAEFNYPSSDAIAYVMFTSGSTGKSKGCMISHRNLFNYISWCNNYYFNDLSTGNWGLMTSMGFDLSVTAIFTSLTRGKKLYLGNEQKTTVQLLEELFNNPEIDTVKLTPTHVTLLKEIPIKDTSIRTVICGGEQLQKQHIQILKDLNKDIRIYNEYGPTETTVGCTVCEVTLEDESITIGSPIANTQIYIVDSEINPLPVGVQGELLIGGVQVAKGYMNRNELTAKKFIPDPFNAGSNNQLYRTGDLAKWNEDGSISYIGRVDDQVKIRGYRVELPEIESHLNDIPEIHQSVVLLKKRGDKTFLVGYYESEQELDARDLRNQLSQDLPDYMLPNYFIHLEKLPVNLNGKISKKELLEFDILANREYVAASSEVEQKMAAIWQEVLGVERVGIHDNFFELGGDSIKTIQIVNKCKKEGIFIQTKDLIDNQTIFELLMTSNAVNRSIISEVGVLSGDLLLHPIQKRFFEMDYHNVNHYNQSVLLTISKDISKERLESNITQLAEIHDSLRLRFERDDNNVYPQQKYGSLSPRVYEEEVSNLDGITNICNTYQSALSIEEGDIVRFVLLKTPEEELYDRLLIVIHHLAIDGVSWRILVEDLAFLLEEYASGKQLSLPKKGTSYRQWISKLKDYSSKVEREEYTYWKEVLSNYQELPTDFEYSQATTFGEINSYRVSLPYIATQELIYDVPKVYGTEINDVLISGLALSLKDFLKTSKVVITLEGHGREAILEETDISRTTGWFTSLYPVCLHLADADNLGFLIPDIKDTLNAIPNKGLGYSILRYLSDSEEVKEELSVNYEDIIFNYLGDLSNSLSDNRESIGIAKESTGKDTSDKNIFGHKLYFGLMIIDGSLQLNCKYDSNKFKRETIIQLTDGYISALEKIVTHCKDLLNQQDYIDVDQEYEISFL